MFEAPIELEEELSQMQSFLDSLDDHEPTTTTSVTITQENARQTDLSTNKGKQG